MGGVKDALKRVKSLSKARSKEYVGTLSDNPMASPKGKKRGNRIRLTLEESRAGAEWDEGGLVSSAGIPCDPIVVVTGPENTEEQRRRLTKRESISGEEEVIYKKKIDELEFSLKVCFFFLFRPLLIYPI
eukprot:TRINITY_DN8803_c0_g2_i1.p2 TRINITY_DN8803_c0_g2~~TRINITY_DN8803_c0_g2_i1.p2  ORF type:complete len:130 (-),score=25.13 TRINITY_DN8803_c0_g2_i1:544-933(-)